MNANLVFIIIGIIVVVAIIILTLWLISEHKKDKKKHRDCRTGFTFLETLDRLFAKGYYSQYSI